MEDHITLLENAVEKLAFDMPAPNQHTPRFIQLVGESRRIRTQARIDWIKQKENLK
jgi:hypothetical protein